MSAQDAEIQSVTIYEARQCGDMGRFLAKIGANNAALAPYVKHVIFTADLDAMANSGLLRMVQDRRERPGNQFVPTHSCDIAVQHEQAIRDGDHAAIAKLQPFMETDNIPCGPGCVLGREWSICRNVRTVTLPVEWVTEDALGHTPLWQYFDIDVEKQYKYRYKGDAYVVIGDTKAPGTDAGEEKTQHYVARHQDAERSLQRFCARGSKLPESIEHLIIDVHPDEMTLEHIVQMLTSDSFSPSMEEVYEMGLERFVTRAVHAMFGGRNNINSLVVPAKWAASFETSEAFPRVMWWLRCEAMTEVTDLVAVGSFGHSFTKLRELEEGGRLTEQAYSYMVYKVYMEYEGLVSTGGSLAADQPWPCPVVSQRR
jgi:hypothetical protein